LRSEESHFGIQRHLLPDCAAHPAHHAKGVLVAGGFLSHVHVNNHVTIRIAPLPPPDLAVALREADLVFAIEDLQPYAPQNIAIDAFFKRMGFGKVVIRQLFALDDSTLRTVAGGAARAEKSTRK
jgi:hypothetical protein